MPFPGPPVLGWQCLSSVLHGASRVFSADFPEALERNRAISLSLLSLKSPFCAPLSDFSESNLLKKKVCWWFIGLHLSRALRDPLKPGSQSQPLTFTLKPQFFFPPSPLGFSLETKRKRNLHAEGGAEQNPQQAPSGLNCPTWRWDGAPTGERGCEVPWEI